MNDFAQTMAPETARPVASPIFSLARFNLEGVPAHERVPMFREYFGRQILRYDVEPLPDAAFEVDLQFRLMPGLVMMWGRAHGTRNSRTRETLAADVTDDVGLVLNVCGPQRVECHGEEIVLADGEAAIVSLGEPCRFTHRPPGDIVALRVPRRDLAMLVSGIDDRNLTRIPAGTPALRMLGDYLRLLQDGPPMDARLEQTAVGHAHDLMALAIGATRDGTEAARGGLHAARLHAIKKDIAANLGRADLSVAALARRHGCTERFVQRLFEAEGTTFTEFVLKQRLVRARRLLADPGRAGDKIAAIAYDAGFADLSYFNRAFRRHYGDTPSGLRAQPTQYRLPDA